MVMLAGEPKAYEILSAWRSEVGDEAFGPRLLALHDALADDLGPTTS
jgi:hypothetical protein